MLHIENICIAFGTEVLVSGFNMKLERGETACIVGQSVDRLHGFPRNWHCLLNG